MRSAQKTHLESRAGLQSNVVQALGSDSAINALRVVR